jgi:hypothetical protein
MEGEAEQPALPATADEVGDIQEGLGHNLTILNDADPPRLLDDEEVPAAITGIDYLNRLVEAIRHQLEAEVEDARIAYRGARLPGQGGGNGDGKERDAH